MTSLHLVKHEVVQAATCIEDPLTHHSKSAIVSSEYQMYTQRPFGCSPNLTKNIPQE
jgi:hypothetical protein